MGSTKAHHREDKDANGLEPPSTDWKPFLQRFEFPLHEIARRPDDDRTEQV